MASPRLYDLIDLIKNAYDIYIISPNSNIRSSYIQIDDLCELCIKSWLQLDTIEKQKKSIADIINKFHISNTKLRSIDKYYKREISIDQLWGELQYEEDDNNKKEIIHIFDSYKYILKWLPVDENDRYKNFNKIIEEVFDRKNIVAGSKEYEIFNRIKSRRNNRNKFFHDHEQSGLTVDEKNV